MAFYLGNAVKPALNPIKPGAIERQASMVALRNTDQTCRADHAASGVPQRRTDARPAWLSRHPRALPPPALWIQRPA